MTTTLLTGVPRSGTTLCCHLLNQYQNTVALHEPISTGAFDGNRQDAIQSIMQFCLYAREQIRSEKAIVTKQHDGSLPTNPVSDDGGALRKEVVKLGVLEIDKDLSNEFTLLVKHNALFSALLEELTEAFAVYAVVRNPLAVLVSWQTVDLPVHSGHVPMGEKFDAKLTSLLAAKSNVLDRQLVLLSWFFQRYDKLIDPSRIIRYEDVIASNGRCLRVIAKRPIQGQVRLDAQTGVNRISPDQLMALRNALLSGDNVAEPFYSDLEIDAEYRRLSR
jgi:hypothetical protein